MKKRYLLLFIIPIFSFAQLQNKSLWKGYGVQDKNGNSINQNVQKFAFFENNVLSVLTFGEKLNIENGEVELKSRIDDFKTLNITKSDFSIKLKDKTFKVKVINQNEFKIVVDDFQFPFKKMEQPKSIKKENITRLLSSNSFYEKNTKDNVLSDRLIFTPLANGKMKYSKEYSNNEWVSDYMLVEFKNVFFIKSVSAPTLIINLLKKNAIVFTILDYRYDAKPLQWNVYDVNFAEKDQKEITPTTKKMFKLNTTQTYAKCIASLSKTQLNKVISVFTNNISTPITHVQHTYNDRWMLFSDIENRTLKKYKIKMLVSKDSSLCTVFNMPNGYYSTRKNRTSQWNTYLHEERIRTDSSLIIKKAFPHDNSYRIFNELKNIKKTYYTMYYLDTRTLRESGVLYNDKEIGLWNTYDKSGKLLKSVDKSN